MTQRYGQNEHNDEQRRARGEFEDQSRNRYFGHEQQSGSNPPGGFSEPRSHGPHTYGGTSPGGYGSQSEYGPQSGQGQQQAYGGSQRAGTQSQSYAPYGGQQGGSSPSSYGEGYRHSNYGQGAYPEGNYGAQVHQSERLRGGYFAQGQAESPNPGSHSYSGPYSGTYGFGSNAPNDQQLRQGARTAFSDQVSYGNHAAYGDHAHGQGGGAGQSQGGWNPAGQMPRAARRAPKSYQRSDERLKEEIYERLINRWDIDSTEVTVQVASGEVTLDGTVPERRMRHDIENLVDDTHGVKEIHNNLRIQSQSSSWGQSSSQQSTGAEGVSNSSSLSASSNPKKKDL